MDNKMEVLKNQLISEILYFFNLRNHATFKIDKYRKRYTIASDKVASLKTYCRNRVRNTEYVQSPDYTEIVIRY